MNDQHSIRAKMARIQRQLRMGGTMRFGDHQKSICLARSTIASLTLSICVTSFSLTETIIVSTMEVLANETQHRFSPLWNLSAQSNHEPQPDLPETKSTRLSALLSSSTLMTTASKSRCSERAFRRVKNLKDPCTSKYCRQ